MAQEHQRCVVKLSQLLDFWTKRGHAIAEEAHKYLEDKDEELKTKLEEQEKTKKSKKGKKNVEEPEIIPETFKYLPKEMLSKMLKMRVSEEDCNAGVIFEGLNSENWVDEKYAIELICDTLSKENIQLVMFRPQVTK
mmetsp:Transcript_106871/g.147929  ORF Transcript_106871/g.147929 Transcript_106871/m.147929 type:complete len:137 (+) Transcript_106871:139-549(+)